MTLQIEAAGITHRGTVRENNEDCIAIGYWLSQETMEAARVFEHALDLPFACVVADGMGGHNAGEVASVMAVDALDTFFRSYHADPRQPWPHQVDTRLSPTLKMVS